MNVSSGCVFAKFLTAIPFVGLNRRRKQNLYFVLPRSILRNRAHRGSRLSCGVSRRWRATDRPKFDFACRLCFFAEFVQRGLMARGCRPSPKHGVRALQRSPFTPTLIFLLSEKRRPEHKTEPRQRGKIQTALQHRTPPIRFLSTFADAANLQPGLNAFLSPLPPLRRKSKILAHRPGRLRCPLA